jgi:hypothetical protein
LRSFSLYLSHDYELLIYLKGHFSFQSGKQESVAVGEVLDGNGAPISRAQVSPTGVFIHGLNHFVVLDAGGSPIWVNSQSHLLNGNGTAKYSHPQSYILDKTRF